MVLEQGYLGLEKARTTKIPRLDKDLRASRCARQTKENRRQETLQMNTKIWKHIFHRDPEGSREIRAKIQLSRLCLCYRVFRMFKPDNAASWNSYGKLSNRLVINNA